MAKHNQRIRRQQPTNCLSVFGHFVELALKGLMSQNGQTHFKNIAANNAEIYHVCFTILGSYTLKCEYMSKHQKLRTVNSSVIRQKCNSQNECFKKTKHVKFSEKRTFITYPLIRGTKC